MSKSKTSKLYSEVYAEAQAAFDKYKPCQIEIDENGKASCFASRASDEGYRTSDPSSGELCCIGCKYLGKNGCKVKCLGCKLYLCSRISADHPIRIILAKLRQKAGMGMSHIRKSKKESIKFLLEWREVGGGW